MMNSVSTQVRRLGHGYVEVTVKSCDCDQGPHSSCTLVAEAAMKTPT